VTTWDGNQASLIVIDKQLVVMSLLPFTDSSFPSSTPPSTFPPSLQTRPDKHNRHTLLITYYTGNSLINVRKTLPQEITTIETMASTSAIPTSTSVLESAVIRAPLAKVWHHIKLHEFANFWTALKGSELVKGVSHEADVARWTFKDGTVLDVKQEEHSVSCQQHPHY
jgi:hypothetical protein